jgi:ribonuclease P protein component
MTVLPPSSVAAQGSGDVAARSRHRLRARTRLRTRYHLEHVRREGRRDAGSLCVVSAVCPPPDAACRVAFIVSRRYSPKAVVRNRARRLLREAYRQTVAELAPAWLVLLPRRRLQQARLPEVLLDLRSACRRIGLLER